MNTIIAVGIGIFTTVAILIFNPLTSEILKSVIPVNMDLASTPSAQAPSSGNEPPLDSPQLLGDANPTSAEPLPITETDPSDQYAHVQEPETSARNEYTVEELRQYVFELINKDRADAGLPPVALSDNQAAQIHSDNMLASGRMSHWNSNGMKPYMEYTVYGGTGSVQQNAAAGGYTSCESGSCLLFDVKEGIAAAQYGMVHEDEQCCDNGHRDNILNEHHTHVSIGIALLEHGFLMTQNFENHYFNLDTPFTKDGRSVTISGQYLPGVQEYSIYGIEVNYDEFPTLETYQEALPRRSYDEGQLVLLVAKPLQEGAYYPQKQGYVTLEAESWFDDGRSIDIKFSLASAMKEKGEGVYTISVYISNDNTSENAFAVTSYSIFIKG